MATRDSYTPASDESVYEVDSFELLWEQHKGKVIFGIVAVLAIVGGFFGWLYVSSANKKAAAAAYAEATTPEAWREVIAKYPKSPVAGNAAILLAQSLRDAGNIDEADKVLADFVAAQPKAQFVPLASLAIAENEALAGKTKEAEESLQLLSETDANSFVAPFALMMKAQLHLANWERDAAMRSLDLLYANFSDSVSGDSAQPLYESLRAMARPVNLKEAPTAASDESTPTEGAGATDSADTSANGDESSVEGGSNP